MASREDVEDTESSATPSDKQDAGPFLFADTSSGDAGFRERRNDQYHNTFKDCLFVPTLVASALPTPHSA